MLRSLLRLIDTPSLVPLFLAVNAFAGTVVYVRPALFGIHLFAAAVLATVLAVVHVRNNLVFQARLLLLVCIGYYAALIKIIDSDAFFSPVEPDAQTIRVAARMFGLTSIALFGAMAGLLFNTGRLRKGGCISKGINSNARLLRPALPFYVVAVLLTGYLSAKSYGPSVFVTAYASGEGEGQVLGNLQAIGVVCLVMAFVSIPDFSYHRYRFFLFGLAAYYLGWGILIRGGRLEVLSGLFALLVALPAARGTVFRFELRHYVAAVGVALFLEAWGTLRSTLSDIGNASETVIEGYQRLADAGIYHAGTISGIATTFSNVIHMLDSDVLDWRLGGTYFDYLLRSPPEFIYPNRPPDLSWMFQDYGYQAIGGFFELSEAYLNFGVFGCLIVPFLISFVIATTYKRAVSGSLLWFFIFAAILAVFFRGALYQTFAFYKGILTGVIIYLIILFLSRVFPSKFRTSKMRSVPSHDAC